MFWPISLYPLNPSSASLRIKVSSSCLIKCRRIVSKSVDELSQKTCRRRRHSGIFRYVLPPSFFVVNINSLHLHLTVTIDHYDTVGGRERETIGKIEISNKE